MVNAPPLPAGGEQQQQQRDASAAVHRELVKVIIHCQLLKDGLPVVYQGQTSQSLVVTSHFTANVQSCSILIFFFFTNSVLIQICHT